MPLKGVLGSGCWPFPSVLGGSWGIAKHVSTNLVNGPQRSSSRPRAPQDLWSPWPEARRRWSETQICGQGLGNSLAEQPKSVWALEPPVGIPTGRGRPGALASRSTCLPAPLPRQATPAQQCCVCTLSVPFGTSISRFFRSVQSARSMTSSQAKFGAEKHHFKKNCPITRAFGLRNLKKIKNRRGSQPASKKGDMMARWATPQRPWVVLAPQMKKVLPTVGSVTTSVSNAMSEI